MRAPTSTRSSRAADARGSDDAVATDGRHEAGAETDDSESTLAERPSKTRRKQESHALQALGERAVELSDDRLTALALAEPLLDAILTYRKTRTHEGRRRQMQYIGKLMRLHDIEPIRAAVDDLQLGRAKDALALHESERWRAELLAGDDALTRWMSEHPAADLQQLRSLIRAARKDAALIPEQRSGRAYRELFQFIKQHAQRASADVATPE